ncbi:sugar phosphate isomerase/epimerase family protein [Streptococcus loxodontisalivarius]|uniref:Sugar phosphate isomerase/epimerase n=1 Tax=Streptococcus loxodontisalivarius TaxID=1349415 RepID=A0ABS2PPT5_9STRE|nr:TIM barrel protein [Streptococcus loxodontisalivarius]MBM7641990.1 sugar phosphate isomerase/epimerase [Streptococcus loxodontisalivarius]
MIPIRLGLKASSDPKQVESRLRYHPQVFEFHTDQEDFSTEGLKRLEEAIIEVRNAGVETIILHHPMKYKERFCELLAHSSNNSELVNFIDSSIQDLLTLAKKYDAKVLVHGSYEMREPDLLTPFDDKLQAQNYLLDRLLSLYQKYPDHLIFENGIWSLFAFGHEDFDKKLAQTKLPLAYDISHAFIELEGDMAALLTSLDNLKDNIQHYHLVDSMGRSHDSLTLGQGKVDWAAVLPHLNPNASYIYEINLADMTNPAEQLASHEYLVGINRKK